MTAWRGGAAGLFVLVGLLATLGGFDDRVPAPTAVEASRIVAIGDIHGDLQALTAILGAARLIDDAGRWIGGSATLVQTGDFTDRGPEVRAVMDLLMRLEQEAAASGGRVVVLLGNHEGMNLLGEVRDVSAETYAGFVDDRSDARREAAYREQIALAEGLAARWPQAPPLDPSQSKPAWMARHPPGFLEYRAAFEPTGTYGRWLRSRPLVMRIGESVFMHAGIDPATAPPDLDEINETAWAELEKFDAHRAVMIREELILPFFTLQETIGAARAEVGSRTAWVSEVDASAQRVEADDDETLAALSKLLEIGSWSLISPDGPLWYRGFSRWGDEEGADLMSGLLERYDVKRFVVAHTPTPSRRIVPRFSRGLFVIDTGMLASAYGGVPSALEIRGQRVAAVYPDGRVELEPAGLAARGESPVWHESRRGARLARREERECREYLTDEQRRQPRCNAGWLQQDFHHGLLAPRVGATSPPRVPVRATEVRGGATSRDALDDRRGERRTRACHATDPFDVTAVRALLFWPNSLTERPAAYQPQPP